MNTPPDDLSEAATQPARVLIADADPGTVALVEQTLAAAGYDVTVAATGPEALHYTDADAPDIYVLDRDLPEMDGLRVARHLRRSYQVPVGRIVLLDGNALSTYYHPGLQAMVLRKPFTGVELLLTVMNQLEEYRQTLVAKVPRVQVPRRRGRPRKAPDGPRS